MISLLDGGSNATQPTNLLTKLTTELKKVEGGVSDRCMQKKENGCEINSLFQF